MPITDWSTTGGDLRVPHFTGLHGIHVLLLVVAVLGLLSRRYRWLRDERVRGRLVGIAAVGYSGLFGVLAWQAWRGQSVLHPDRPILTGFALVGLVTVALAAAVVQHARRLSARLENAVAPAAATPARRPVDVRMG
jgi:hypothetical protein